MARMPLKINQTSTRPREVTVVVQVEDPDYEGAAQSAKDNGEKLPPGW